MNFVTNQTMSYKLNWKQYSNHLPKTINKGEVERHLGISRAGEEANKGDIAMEKQTLHAKDFIPKVVP